MFSAVSIACEKIPLTMSSISCLVSPAVLFAMDDSDPAVCPQAWDAVLSVVKNIVVRNNIHQQAMKYLSPRVIFSFSVKRLSAWVMGKKVSTLHDWRIWSNKIIIIFAKSKLKMNLPSSQWVLWQHG